jgi:2-methylcitrate dehydratase PrpD
VTAMSPRAARGAAAPAIAVSLARFMASLSLEGVPESVAARARYLILDAVGIAFASGRFDFARRTLAALRSLADGSGDSMVIGFPDRLPFRDAAIANGVLVHGLDFDDTHLGGVVHATASLVPTILAVGARLRCSGAAALAAYVGGVEAMARLGAVAKGGFHQVGFHPTGLVGAFACTLAAGKLMGLDEQQLATAQGIVLSTASGTLEFLEDGAWNKRLHPGWAAAAGITAATLAQHGFIGATKVYEGRFGLYASHLQERFAQGDLHFATAALGERWEIIEVAVKPFPACHFTHACADAAIALKREHDIDPRAIRRIRAVVPVETVKTVCEPLASKRRPANAYDAQFSIPFIVASALRCGRFGLAELSDEALADRETLDLADRVEYEIDPASEFPRFYSGELILERSDGVVLRHREARNRGSSDRPLGQAEILAKFAGNCRGTAAEARADRVANQLLSLHQAADMGDVAAQLGIPS